MSDLLIAAMVLLGGLGYAISLVLILGMRLYLGRGGRGWPSILLNSLLLREIVLTATFGVTLFNIISPPGEFRRNAVRIALTVAFFLVPWVLIFTLGPWFLGQTRRDDGGGGPVAPPPPVAAPRRWRWPRGD